MTCHQCEDSEASALRKERDEARAMLLDADSHIEELKYLNRRARDEAARLREALSEISCWRKGCHEYDEDMGHPLRDMDEGEIEAIEKYAGRILQEGGDEQ
jgi:hypothetical protein